jgi:GH18 family chitinase
MHDYRKGMLHLAHESGVQVYPSITLGEGATLSSIPADVFVANAVALMIDGGFDGIDLDLALSVGSPSRSTLLQAAEVDALRGILVALRTKIVELMVRDNRAYGLTMVMPCALHATPNLADALSLVDEVNLMTFDFNSPSRSERVVPISPLYSNPTVQGSAESVDSCVSDWTSAVMMGGTEGSMGAALARDKINVGLSFDGRVYRGAQALYGPHDTTMLPPAGGVEDDDAKVPYYEVYRQLLDGSLSRGWDDVTKTMFGGNTRGELITYEDTMSVCWKTEYGIESGTNGYFVW